MSAAQVPDLPVMSTYTSDVVIIRNEAVTHRLTIKVSDGEFWTTFIGRLASSDNSIPVNKLSPFGLRHPKIGARFQTDGTTLFLAEPPGLDNRHERCCGIMMLSVLPDSCFCPIDGRAADVSDRR